MLSEVTEYLNDIEVTEITEGQKLNFRVGPVFGLEVQDRIGVWITYDDSKTEYGPALIDYDSWKKVNKHIKRKWRSKTWRTSTFYGRALHLKPVRR